MAAKSRNSTKCGLESCNRQVRYDNPTFPYCNYHASLKTMRSSYEGNPSMSVEEAMETLYAPGILYVRPVQSRVDRIHDSNSGMREKEVMAIAKTWLSHTRGKNMNDPDQAYGIRDELVSTTKQQLSTMGDARVVDCRGGYTVVSGNMINTNEHKVVYFDNGDGKFIVDPASAAPLKGKIHGTVDSVFSSGETTCGDGIYVAPLFEYAEFSSVSYSEMVDENGSEIWSGRAKNEDDDIDRQRLLVKNSPDIVYEKIEYKTSINDYKSNSPSENSDDNNSDMTLEELLFSDD